MSGELRVKLGALCRFAVVVGLAVSAPATIAIGSAKAEDLNAALSDAESSASSASMAIEEAGAKLGPAEARYDAITRRVLLANKTSEAARRQADRFESAAQERQLSAAAQVSKIEADHKQAVDNHNEQVWGGFAFGLAALLTAALALGWNWFRASAAVAWLTELPLGQAVGLCVGGGLVLLIAGGAMLGADSALVAVGGVLFFLALVLPVAFLSARHSAQIQRGRAKSLLKQERMPGWVTKAISIVALVICLAGLGSAIFASSPEQEEVSAALQSRARGHQPASATRRLAFAEAKAAELQGKASKLSAEQSAARAVLVRLRNELRFAKRQLTRAQDDAQYYTQRLEVIAAREARQAEAEEAEPLEEEAASGCDPNYSGCVPPYPPDVDCADVGGSVSVYGSDPHGLDADGDGIGCE